MDRKTRALAALLVSLVGVGCVAPAQAQVCPWGMHAQVQMQIQWQHQQMLQQQMTQRIQTQMAHQQAMQQHLLAQATATQQRQQAMQARTMAQMQHAAQNQLAVVQARNQQHQRLLEHQRSLSARLHLPVSGHGNGPGNGGHANPYLQWQLTVSRRMQELSRTQEQHHVKHLQNITATQRLSAQREKMGSDAARHAQQLSLASRTKSVSIHRPLITTHRDTTASSHHSPSVKVRASMNMTCGHCHQGQPSPPTVAVKPPSNAFKTLLQNRRRPEELRAIAGQVRPGLPKAIAQPPRQPLLPFVASGPVIRPIVGLPRTTPGGQPPPRFAMVAPLGSLAHLQPPPLPALIDKPLNLVPLRPAPDASSPQASTEPLGRASSSGDDKDKAAPSSMESTMLQLVSTIVKSKPSERRRDDDDAEATLLLPEMAGRAPPRPALAVKYPMPSLMLSEQAAPSPVTKPSLLEVVLQPPPLPALPEPIERTTSVP